MNRRTLVSCAIVLGIATMLTAKADDKSAPDALNFKVKNLAGKEVNLAEHEGKVVLIVNVASNCGYTPQYEGFQELYDKYKDKGLVILGFPCNQFGKQEPGTSDEIAEFCKQNYGVTFDMFEKVEVNGPNATPLYQYLTSEKAVGADAGKVNWNFEKFLVTKDGAVKRFRSKVTPAQLDKEIAAALGEKA